VTLTIRVQVPAIIPVSVRDKFTYKTTQKNHSKLILAMRSSITISSRMIFAIVVQTINAEQSA
jgi:hypothetical protein